MLDQSVSLLPLAKRFVWRMRDDVRKGQSANLTQFPASFEQWWLVRGRSEYPAWSALNDDEIKWLATPKGSIKLGGVELPLPQALTLLLHYRTDVVQKFTQEGKLNALAVAGWFFALGRREHLLHDIVGQDVIRLLDKTVVLTKEQASDDVPSTTLLMRLVWHMLDSSLQATMPLDKANTREQFIAWFFGAAVRTFELQELVSNRWRQWLLQEISVPSAGNVATPRFAKLMHGLLPEMAQQFDLTTPEGVKKLTTWAEQALLPNAAWYWLKSNSKNNPALTLTGKPVVKFDSKPMGVNIYGFAYGELGIGEDLRMAVAACEAADIPYRVVNIDAGKDLRQADVALKAHVLQSETVAPYAVNLFCLPGFDMVSRVFLRMGPEVFHEHINIGWWPWELSVWPQAWGEAFDLVDELWAGSEFTRATYVAASSKPVRLMPLPASVERGSSLPRRSFGLPARKFLYLFIFDFNSHLARKNPMAAIEAFKQAFLASDKEVNLVLKVMNAKESDPSWKAFLKVCETDDRIWLITETLDREDVLALINVCDVYMSLHRAEGFGRTLAEAMLYGKPVVATGYSGNADFMHPDYSFAVDYKTVPVEQGAYPFVEQQDSAVWAEPSISDAAMKLRFAKANAQDKNFGYAIRAFALQQFSAARIGKLMKARLNELSNELKLK
jgi:glycosyltransferase involved in cell wall biosynthesis